MSYTKTNIILYINYKLIRLKFKKKKTHSHEVLQAASLGQYVWQRRAVIIKLKL